jgi:hypothetical protein
LGLVEPHVCSPSRSSRRRAERFVGKERHELYHDGPCRLLKLGTGARTGRRGDSSAEPTDAGGTRRYLECPRRDQGTDANHAAYRPSAGLVTTRNRLDVQPVTAATSPTVSGVSDVSAHTARDQAPGDPPSAP